MSTLLSVSVFIKERLRLISDVIVRRVKVVRDLGRNKRGGIDGMKEWKLISILKERKSHRF